MKGAVLKKVDEQGRITIPAEWRKGWKSNDVLLVLKDDSTVEVVPLEPIPPSHLFDAIPIQNDVDFADPHSLRRALLEGTEADEVR